MRVVHVNFARGFRGGERQSLNLMLGLSALGCRQTLVCRPGSELMMRTADEADVALRPSSHPLSGHVDVPHADLIHVHEARGAYWAWLEHRLRDTPYLITRRVVNPISSSWLTHKVYDDAAALVGVSGDVARRLAAETGRRAEVVFDSCSPLRPDGDQVRRIRRELGGAPVIGHVGVLHDAVKGQSTLIEAFRGLTSIWPDARLLLVGDGPDRERLQVQAGGDARIVFAGQQRNVADWIAAMDMFAFPSRVEALGSSVLDAMMLGVPVAASVAGGLPELIGDEERGLSVDSHDPADWRAAMERLLSDGVLRQRLIDGGRAFAAQNDVKANAARYLSLYREVLCGVNSVVSA